MAKGGVPVLIRTLASVEDQDPTAADAISGMLNIIAPHANFLGGKVMAYVVCGERAACPPSTPTCGLTGCCLGYRTTDRDL